MIFDKGAKIIQWEKNSIFNNLHWKNWISTCKRMKLDLYLTPCTKTNSKWIKDLNVKSEIIKLLGKNVGQNLHDAGFDFLDMIPKAQAIKLYIDKLDSTKKFLCIKNNTNKVKR